MRPIRLALVAVVALILSEAAPAQTASRPVAPEPVVGAFYFYWYRHPGEHFTNPDGSDGLFQHFTNPKAVDWRSKDWHRGELEAMMDVGIDVVLPVYWGIPDKSPKEHRAGSFSDEGLEALVLARRDIEAGGGSPPRIAMFYDTSTLLRRTRGEDREGTLDLRTEDGRGVFRDTILRFFERVPESARFTMDGFPLIVLYSSFGAQHDRDLLDRVADEVKPKLGRRPFFIAEESWNARAGARYRWGAALGGPTGDSVVRVIGPGYNDTPVVGRSTPIRSREDGRFYMWSWNQVLLDVPTIVLIETWNEFHEGTGIAESKEFGTTYLDITRRSIQRLKRRLLPDPANPVRLAHPDPLPRPDEGWFTADRAATSVSFNPGTARAERGDGLRLAKVEDGPYKIEFLAEKTAATTDGTDRTTCYLYFGVADEFAFATAQSYRLEVEFVDGGRGQVGLQYDSWDVMAAQKGAYKAAPSYKRSGSVRAGTLVYELPDARFANRENGGTDFRLTSTGDPLSITRITLHRLKVKLDGEPRLERK